MTKISVFLPQFVAHWAFSAVYWMDVLGQFARLHHAPHDGGITVTFEVGDKVIYPNQGLGVVTRIEEKTILGTTCGFYHLRIVANETTVLVPLDNVDGVGLRRAIGDEEVERLFNALGNGKIDNHQNWKGRFKDNSAKMRTGPIYEVADVPKSLHAAEPFREPCRSARKGEAPGNGASPFFLLRSPRAFRP
jgi:CarD family transcriptional regulator